MNNKLSFIADVEIDGFEQIKSEQKDFQKALVDLRDYFDLKKCLKKTWEDAEKKFVAHDNKIIDSEDHVEIVSCPDADLCKGVEALMNLAYREGMRKIINNIKDKLKL